MMNIREKLLMDRGGLHKNGAINIVIFGDSVSHGAVAADEINYETVYWNRLRKKINAVRNYVPINMINSSIGGTNATDSLERIDSQVLCHRPDLVIICFGLNDVNGTLESYLTALEIMFSRISASGAEVVFMTPNMLNTYVAEGTEEKYLDYAAVTAGYQNEGRMDLYINSAVELAHKMNIGVCDCYSKWKKLSETEDTTLLLANRINHPTKEMHELFAQSLFEYLFGDSICTDGKNESTMYSE